MTIQARECIGPQTGGLRHHNVAECALAQTHVVTVQKEKLLTQSPPQEKDGKSQQTLSIWMLEILCSRKLYSTKCSEVSNLKYAQ